MQNRALFWAVDGSGRGVGRLRALTAYCDLCFIEAPVAAQKEPGAPGDNHYAATTPPPPPPPLSRCRRRREPFAAAATCPLTCVTSPCPPHVQICVPVDRSECSSHSVQQMGAGLLWCARRLPPPALNPAARCRPAAACVCSCGRSRLLLA